MPNLQLDKTYPIGYLEYPIGDILPNWVFSSVSPLTQFGCMIQWVFLRLHRINYCKYDNNVLAYPPMHGCPLEVQNLSY